MDSFARECGWVPTERAEANIRVREIKHSTSVVNRSQFCLMLA